MFEDFFELVLQVFIVIQCMLYYLFQFDGVCYNQIGVGVYIDWGLVIIFVQDDIGGLEICNVDGQWVSVLFIVESFVVNIGDLL